MAQTVISAITGGTGGQDFLLTGDAGCGKSGCLFEIVEHLVARAIPVIAFRLDRVQPVQTTAAIGAELNLPDSPAVVARPCFSWSKGGSRN